MIARRGEPEVAIGPGEVESPALLIFPEGEVGFLAAEVETRLFQTDPKGRLVLSFRSMKAVKDVIMTQLAD